MIFFAGKTSKKDLIDPQFLQLVDSIASTGSSIEKRFLTPSGQLLYREHQADSLLDTKRLKLTPSTSDRPMSPLAKRRSDESVKSQSKKSGRKYQVDSESESESDDSNEGKYVWVKHCVFCEVKCIWSVVTGFV